MRRLSAFAAIALFVLVAHAASGQQVPRFKAGTDYVTTQVIVRDSKGVFVPDLNLQEFELLEDGVRQTLTSFARIVGGRAVADIAPATPGREGLVLPPQMRQETGRIFVIFIDDVHIQPGDSLPTRRLLQQIRDLVLQDGDLVTMVSTGPSSIQQPLTYDIGKKRFDSATSRVLASGMTPSEIASASQTSQGPAGLRHNAHVAFKTAYDLLDQLAQVPNRRKAFLYVSSGYDFNPSAGARFKAVQDGNEFRNPFESGGQQFAESDLIAELVALTRAAQRANVTFFTMDPRGLTAGPPIDSNLSITAYQAQVNTSISSLKLIAEETGGICLCQANDFTKGLRQINDAMSDYYLIGYTSTNADSTKVRRSIAVRVTRPGATASGYRREYSIRK